MILQYLKAMKCWKKISWLYHKLRTANDSKITMLNEQVGEIKDFTKEIAPKPELSIEPETSCLSRTFQTKPNPRVSTTCPPEASAVHPQNSRIFYSLCSVRYFYSATRLFNVHSAPSRQTSPPPALQALRLSPSTCPSQAKMKKDDLFISLNISYLHLWQFYSSLSFWVFFQSENYGPLKRDWIYLNCV